MAKNGKTSKAQVTANIRNDLSPEGRMFMNLVENALSSRERVLRRFIDPRRDLNTECGYPETEELTTTVYRDMYDREPLAARVVEVFPKECWDCNPSIYEEEDSDTITPFELVWDTVCKSLRGDSLYQDEYANAVWEYCERADTASGIGHFGIILIGIDDGKQTLAEPVEGIGPGGEWLDQAKNKPTASRGYSNPSGFPTSLFLPSINLAPADASVPLPSVTKLADSSPTPAVGDSATIPAASIPDSLRKLLYLRVFDESMVDINRFESDVNNPRFSQPISYNVKLSDPTSTHAGTGMMSISTVEVHWTRVIHIPSDAMLSSEVLAAPRMRPVWNRLCDASKVYGAAGEGYWRGAFPGISIETHPQLAGDAPELSIDRDALRAQMLEYQNRLQRYLALVGMTAKSLAPQVVDPEKQLTCIIAAICIQLGCPKRIFMGTERGELASDQDDDTWEDRKQARRQSRCIPRIIVPLVDRLIAMRVLPRPKGYSCDWTRGKALRPGEQADITLKRVQAMAAYVAGGVMDLMEPLDFLTREMKFDEKEAKQILKGTLEYLKRSLEGTDGGEPVEGRSPLPDPALELDREKSEADIALRKEALKKTPAKPPARPKK